MHGGEFARQEGESDQVYMDRVLSAVFDLPAAGELQRFNEMLKPSYQGCCAEKMSLTVAYEPQLWEANPAGNLHGGIIATAFDITFGSLTRFCTGNSDALTVDLKISYMRGIPLDHPFLVTAYEDKTGQRVRFLHGELYDRVTGKLAATASTMFM
jgi:acyl-CoA thioesterase